jgi:hypothetical protein
MEQTRNFCGNSLSHFSFQPTYRALFCQNICQLLGTDIIAYYALANVTLAVIVLSTVPVFPANLLRFAKIRSP